jgi:hypothetical protein
MNLEGKGTSLIFLICFFIFFPLSLQGQSLRNESWVAMGSTAQTNRVGGVVVQQSIGQSSVAGVFASATTRISQGFLRGIRVVTKEIKLPFEVIAFPNSFSERIAFRFTTEHQEATQVLLYDGLGKLVYEAAHQPKNQEIHLNLPFLASGVYIAHLRSGNKFVQSRIIKKP